jgi:hypothetical protein
MTGECGLEPLPDAISERPNLKVLIGVSLIVALIFRRLAVMTACA